MFIKNMVRFNSFIFIGLFSMLKFTQTQTISSNTNTVKGNKNLIQGK